MFETNAKLEFIDCVNQLLHEATSIFYFFRSDYPIDDDFIKENIALAGLLFDHFHRNEITEIPEIVSKEEQEAILESEKGEDIHVYARILNDKICRSAEKKNQRGYLLLPDIDSLSLQIEDLLCNVIKPNYKRKKILGISSLIEP